MQCPLWMCLGHHLTPAGSNQPASYLAAKSEPAIQMLSISALEAQSFLQYKIFLELPDQLAYVFLMFRFIFNYKGNNCSL